MVYRKVETILEMALVGPSNGGKWEGDSNREMTTRRGFNSENCQMLIFFHYLFFLNSNILLMMRPVK